MQVKEYTREDGSNPYKEWFDNLNSQAAAKVSVAIVRMELGNTSNIKWSGSLGWKKINWGPGYRVYLAQDGKDLIILFGGGTKKGQNKDIKQAKELFAEYKNRKR
jgi:putative addiction module killer protein